MQIVTTECRSRAAFCKNLPSIANGTERMGTEVLCLINAEVGTKATQKVPQTENILMSNMGYCIEDRGIARTGVGICKYRRRQNSVIKYTKGKKADMPQGSLSSGSFGCIACKGVIIGS